MQLKICTTVLCWMFQILACRYRFVKRCYSTIRWCVSRIMRYI